MDDVFGANPWTSSVSNGQVSSNLSQETAIRTEGNGSMRDDIAVVSNNQRAGAIRDDPLPWNWSGYDRLAIWMNKATPGTLWAWVYVQDEKGENTWGLFSLVGGWYRYPMDLGPPLDLTRVSSVEIAFASTGAATGTVYIDDIVLFNSTTFAESAHVAQTFTKAIPTGGSPNSLRLVFDLQATASSNVDATLAVAIGNRVEWSGTPVAGTRTVDVDVSGDVELQGTGLVTATHRTITGTANVTVDLPAIVIPPSSPRDLIIWPAFALVVGAFGAAGFLALRRSAKHAFRMEDLFLINGEGLLIAHTTSRRDSHGDEDILAGMLTAIMSFAQDVFQEEIGGLRQFEIGNKTVALERSEHVYVAAIGSGPIRNRLSTSLRDFLADIEERYGDRLQWWSGMNEDLVGIDAMVQLFAKRERYRRGDWKRHAAPDAGSGPVQEPELGAEIHLVIVPKAPLRPL